MQGRYTEIQMVLFAPATHLESATLQVQLKGSGQVFFFNNLP